MGLCFSRGDRSTPRRRPSKRITNHSAAADGGVGSKRWTRIRSSRKEENLIHERALAAAILFQQQLQNGGGTAPFDRSTSLRYPTGTSKKNQALPRERARSLILCFNHTSLLIRLGVGVFMFAILDIKLDNLETNHFVLVHGGGFGAWCWYKTIALLEEGGYKVTAVDLTGSGIHSSDTNSIRSLSQYVKPLTEFLEKLTDGEKVESNDLMRQAQVFLYANGNNQSPTAIDFDKSLLRDLLFNQSPQVELQQNTEVAESCDSFDFTSTIKQVLRILHVLPLWSISHMKPKKVSDVCKDVALASVSMRPIPFSPVLEKLSLSEANHGCVRRFYIQTLEDNAIPIAVQECMINKNPPEQVFRLKGADHSPFFSKPQALHKVLVEISKIP
ncbi:UNVERIFIED_CONTAM: putative methylesterase 11, chloroplastic [Sesamum radiatum]|uniref:Methylesterase 11, chloroplastic n=1 Tax=Sesamum radiatum TaxID=300843 RepID=A0AAW2P449_SESRA